MLFTFPDLNLYSSPLLFLTLQGVVFAILFIVRWRKSRKTSDLLIGLLLAILCFHRTTYTIGFMDWYDTFRNTKINYYLIAMELSTGPLLYLYVKSITSSGFKLNKNQLWHFLPQLMYTLYRIFIFAFDASQPGFANIQNGVLMEKFHVPIFDPFYVAFVKLQMVLYLAFTIQKFYNYRQKIRQYYSNVFKHEMNWMRNFLAIYILLFGYEVMETLVGMTILDMSWTHKWWYHFVAALAIIYIGIKGYFTDTSKLKDLEFNTLPLVISDPDYPKVLQDYSGEMQKVLTLFQNEKVYLDSDLSLKSLAQKLHFTPGQLSEIINNGFQKNFNDFINAYRVEEVKNQLQAGKHKELSLVGIAMDCGFNSKATFNRVFKKTTGISPSEFLKSITQ